MTSVAHRLDGRAHDAEPDAPRQRLKPRERGADLLDRGLQRAPSLVVHRSSPLGASPSGRLFRPSFDRTLAFAATRLTRKLD